MVNDNELTIVNTLRKDNLDLLTKNRQLDIENSNLKVNIWSS